jgi:tetratricopeptide (TPR) repeat protein
MVSQDRASTSASGNTSSSAGASETQDPNSVNILISNTYQKLGDLYSDMKQEDKAREQYKKAEAPLTLVFTGVEAKWPNHVEGAFDRNMLGVLYVKENRYSDAEQQFRIALKTFESSQGKTGENTKTLAENLAYALKLQHRDADAQAVAQQYSVKAD